MMEGVVVKAHTKKIPKHTTFNTYLIGEDGNVYEALQDDLIISEKSFLSILANYFKYKILNLFKVRNKIVKKKAKKKRNNRI